jgi:hypothetical protein
VLVAGVAETGGDLNRTIFWFMNEPIPDFDYQTPDALVRGGKAQVVVDYIESISSGSAG